MMPAFVHFSREEQLKGGTLGFFPQGDCDA
jgi:hypothetical protein